jgi:transposase
MGSSGTRYSKEFKVEAVAQVVDRGYTVKEVATRIGVSQYSLYQWVKKARQQHNSSPSSCSPAELATENARLKNELKRVEEERDILRKAAAYFAKESERSTPS